MPLDYQKVQYVCAHYLSFFSVVPFYVFALCGKKPIDNTLKLTTALLIAFLAYYPWLPILIAQYYQDSDGLLWIPLPTPASLAKTFNVLLFGAKPGISGLAQLNEFHFFSIQKNAVFVALYSIIGLTAAFFLTIKKNYTLFVYFIFSVFAIFFMYYYISHEELKIYHDRYLLHFLPFFIIFVFSTIFKIFGKKTLVAITAAYLLLVFSIKPQTDDKIFQSLAAEIKRQNPRQVITTHPKSFVLLKYYLLHSSQINEYKLYNFSNPNEDFSPWVIIDASFQIYDLENLPDNTLVVTKNNDFITTLPFGGIMAENYYLTPLPLKN